MVKGAPARGKQETQGNNLGCPRHGLWRRQTPIGNVPTPDAALTARQTTSELIRDALSAYLAA